MSKGTWAGRHLREASVVNSNLPCRCNMTLVRKLSVTLRSLLCLTRLLPVCAPSGSWQAQLSTHQVAAESAMKQQYCPFPTDLTANLRPMVSAMAVQTPLHQRGPVASMKPPSPCMKPSHTHPARPLGHKQASPRRHPAPPTREGPGVSGWRLGLRPHESGAQFCLGGCLGNAERTLPLRS